MLPIFKDENKNLMLMQTQWAGQLNPVTTNPLLQGRLIQNINLVSSQPNIINHKLGHKLQGWFVVGSDAVVSLYDNQSTNSIPSLTLILVASAPATVSLWVF